MSSFDDVGAEMGTFEDLLAGLVGPDEAPPALREVARLVHIARGPATGEELAGEKLLAAEVAAVVRHSLPLTARSPWRGRVVRLASVKAAGLAAAVLVGGGVAAAATGSLPAPVQQVVAKSLHHIGLSLPLPSKRASFPPVTPPGPSASARSAALCRAYDLRPASVSTVGLEELRRLAAASGEGVASYCQAMPARHHLPPTTTTPNSAVPGSTAPGHASSKGAVGSSKGRGHGGGEGHPATTTPRGTIPPPGSSASHRHQKKGDEPGGGQGAKGTGTGTNPGKASSGGAGSGSGGGGVSTPGAGTSGTAGGSGHGGGGGNGGSPGGSSRGGHLIKRSRALARSLARRTPEIGSIGTSVGKGA